MRKEKSCKLQLFFLFQQGLHILLKSFLSFTRKNRSAHKADRLITYLFPLIYGWPEAFGASARPMKPVNAMIVST